MLHTIAIICEYVICNYYEPAIARYVHSYILNSWPSSVTTTIAYTVTSYACSITPPTGKH